MAGRRLATGASLAGLARGGGAEFVAAADMAFAAREAAGLALVTVLGFVLLGEGLTPVKVAALLGLGLGTYLLHRGTHAAGQQTTGQEAQS